MQSLGSKGLDCDQEPGLVLGRVTAKTEAGPPPSAKDDKLKGEG
jgi:hypothetical protein